MKIAFGRLRYTPEVFWAFTLREWQAAVEGYVEKEYGTEASDRPLSREELNALMERYPDDRPPH